MRRVGLQNLAELLNLPEPPYFHDGKLYYLFYDEEKDVYPAFGYIDKGLINSLYGFDDEENEILNKRGVKSTKWGKLLKMLWSSLSEMEIETHIRKIKGITTKDNTFELRDNIVETYEKTSLRSCMSGHDARLTRLYEVLGCKILVQKSPSGKELSRSIIWPKLDVINYQDLKEVMLCDRIYSFTEADYENHVKYALNMGAIVRSSQEHHDNDNFYIKENTKRVLGLRYSLEKNEVSEEDINDIPWPYLDTLDKYDHVKLTFSNCGPGYECRSTDGASLYLTKEECPYCRAEIDEDTCLVCDGNYCVSCATYCAVCGEYYPPDECTQFHHNSDYICNNCLNDSDIYVKPFDADYVYKMHNIYYCEDIEEYAVDAYYCETDNNYYYYSRGLIEINNAFYLESDPNIIKHEETGKFCLKSDLEEEALAC